MQEVTHVLVSAMENCIPVYRPALIVNQRIPKAEGVVICSAFSDGQSVAFARREAVFRPYPGFKKSVVVAILDDRGGSRVKEEVVTFKPPIPAVQNGSLVTEVRAKKGAYNGSWITRGAQCGWDLRWI